MQPKISKTLEGIIARSAFNTTKAGMTHSLKDFLTLELLREEGSLAYQLLSSRLKDWELYQVRLRIEREVISAKQQETRSPEEYYRDFTEELLAMPGVARSVSTAHALLAIISDRSTATARVLEMYGVTADSVSGDLQKFAVGDDFRTEVQVHMLDFGEENRNEEKGPAHLLDKFGVNLTRLAREGKIDPIIGREQEIERVVQILSRRKKNNPILIGEAGVGKSAIAKAIHKMSNRANGPFITINCGALDENLLIDTLFGHVKGAFTEARQPRKGAFLTAEGGTLMLDEIGNAAPKVQQALLRALSTRMIRPLGSDEDVPFDTRIIAATNAELLQDAQEGPFREDLYYRLAVITIRTPPLRRRKSDLPLLAVFFLTRAAESQGLPTPRLSRGALRKLQEYHWPGNVRELQNCLTRALAFCENGLIFAENIQLGPDTLPGDIARPERGKLSCPPARADSRQPHNEAVEAAEPSAVQPAPAESEEQGATPVVEDTQPRLNARLARLLPQIVELGSISRQEYQDMAGKDISMRTAQYDLQILVRLGLVRKEGRGPAQRYIVLPAARGVRA